MTQHFERIDSRLRYQAWRKPQHPGHCRYCDQLITAKRRRTFCSEACVHEWKIRTNPGYVRLCLEEREHGICQACGLDCQALGRVLRGFRRLGRQLASLDPPDLLRSSWVGHRERLLLDLGFSAKVVSHIRGQDGQDLWAADHIIPVCEGGGLCGLEGYRTLCHICHAVETAELSRRRAARRQLVKRTIRDDTFVPTCSPEALARMAEPGQDLIWPQNLELPETLGRLLPERCAGALLWDPRTETVLGVQRSLV